MKLLVLDTKQILATGDCIETDTELQYPDQIVPKHVVPGYQFVEADLPADYAPGKYLWDNGFIANPDYAPPVEP
jgi:hypothetical protein